MPLPKHMPALDALRGIAVTLVIASHAFPMASNLPWTVKRFSNLGFFGVQLFFVVSSITLANSWRRSEQASPPSLRGFALRRLFRIAPAYFLASAGYALLPPGFHPDGVRLLTFVTFTSGWSPAQMPTVQGAWIGVPGGWSIEAEFAFYALFPCLMMAVRGLGRAAMACALSLPLAWIANRCAWVAYQPVYGDAATGQFLYYWLPNQLPVFLLGLAAYEAMAALSPGGKWQRLGQAAAGQSAALCAACLAGFLLLAGTGWPRLPRPDHLFLPVHLLAAITFAVAAAALSLRPLAPVVNRWSIALGQASFSAYLLHFAIIDGLLSVLPTAFFEKSGYPAAAAGCLLFVTVLVLTAIASQISYRMIELPGIRLGARAIASTRRARNLSE